MIITRTADTVEFRLSETRSHRINLAEVSAVAFAIARSANGKLAPALEIQRSNRLAERIEASLECLSVMHARIVELMAEIAGPAMAVAHAGNVDPELYHC